MAAASFSKLHDVTCKDLIIVAVAVALLLFIGKINFQVEWLIIGLVSSI